MRNTGGTRWLVLPRCRGPGLMSSEQVEDKMQEYKIKYRDLRSEIPVFEITVYARDTEHALKLFKNCDPDDYYKWIVTSIELAQLPLIDHGKIRGQNDSTRID